MEGQKKQTESRRGSKEEQTSLISPEPQSTQVNTAVARQEAVFSLLLLLCHQLYPITSTHKVMRLLAK